MPDIINYFVITIYIRFANYVNNFVNKFILQKFIIWCLDCNIYIYGDLI